MLYLLNTLHLVKKFVSKLDVVPSQKGRPPATRTCGEIGLVDLEEGVPEVKNSFVGCAVVLPCRLLSLFLGGFPALFAFSLTISQNTKHQHHPTPTISSPIFGETIKSISTA